MVILDTNIIIDHLRRVHGSSLLTSFTAKNPEETLAISVISIQELYQGRSTRDVVGEEILSDAISPLMILPYNFEVARAAGILTRDSERLIGLADAAIAATTIINNGQLLTLNKKDFQGIKDLELFDFS